MTARLRVPTYLQFSTDVGGPERVAWLAALPNRVEELTARWGLDLGEPFEPGGNCSWVAPGTDRNGREVVLKVAWQHTEALHEAEGLAALGGQGAVEVYAFEHLAPARPGDGPPGDTDTTAMLLERCHPGTELRSGPVVSPRRGRRARSLPGTRRCGPPSSTTPQSGQSSPAQQAGSPPCSASGPSEVAGGPSGTGRRLSGWLEPPRSRGRRSGPLASVGVAAACRRASSSRSARSSARRAVTSRNTAAIASGRPSRSARMPTRNSNEMRLPSRRRPGTARRSSAYRVTPVAMVCR